MPTKESDYWQDKLDELRRTQLDGLRATASKWQATIATLLGIFGSVAFVGGVTKVNELSSGDATWAKLLVSVAVVLALLSVGSAAYASMGVPRREDNPEWTWLRDISVERAKRALVALRVSQVLALAAAVCVVGGSLIVLYGSPAKSTDPASYVVVADGTTFCGTLTTEDGTLHLDVGGDDTIPLDGDVAQVTSVSSCPSTD